MNNNVLPQDGPINYNSIDPNVFNTMWMQDMDSQDAVMGMIKRDENITNKKYTYKKINGYHIFNNIPPERIQKGKEGWEVEYSYNNELFRSDHFIKDHDGLHILFGGCSNTEGVGSNIQDNWSYRLYKDISKQNKTSGFFNIAKGGYGWHQIVSNFKIYVEKYGAPDYYFVLHPNMLRYYVWKEEKNSWNYIQRNEGQASSRELDLEYRNKFPDWATLMSLFEAYCKSIGTKFLWTTWASEQNENIKNSKFFESTFFETPLVGKDWLGTVRPDGNIERDDVNFRDGHPGKIAHELWHKSFKDELTKKGWFFN